MKSYDFEAVVYDGEVYCEDCCPVDSESEEVSPISADSEWDYYPVCSVCHTKHDYANLTADGHRYETEQAGPQEDDLIIQDTVRSGYSLQIAGGKFLGHYADYDATQQAAIKYMQSEGFYPNLWYINERGTVDLLAYKIPQEQ